MKSNQIKLQRFSRFTLSVPFLLCAFFSFGFSVTAQDKLKPEEIIAKHLESIGAIETRSSITTRIIAGEVTFKFLREGGIRGTGRTVLASDGLKHLLGMQFDNSDYPMDRFGYDSKKVTVAFTKPGARSPLGLFLRDFNDILEYGLLGGTLSSSWPFADMNSRNAKISGGGKKKINGIECYSIDFSPKKGSDLKIKLYFDVQNFQHVRTSYEVLIAARMGTNPAASAAQREQRYEMYEDFSDYRKEGGLMLPHSYKIYLAADGRATGTTEYEWMLTLNQFSFNQKIDEKSFNVEAQ